jgi:hypothetical protein
MNEGLTREMGRHVAAFYNETKMINAKLEANARKARCIGDLNTKFKIEQISE